MEVTLSAELQATLARVAQQRGTDLAREAIERLVDYDDWLVREVEKGLAQIAADHTLTHDEVGARLNEHLSGKQSRRWCSFRWTEKAANDLERIADHLLLHVPDRASELVRRVYEAPTAPLTFPNRGRPEKREGTRAVHGQHLGAGSSAHDRPRRPRSP
jgi:plasmid stabilization system protein ParE/predicted transcriptional regulator